MIFVSKVTSGFNFEIFSKIDTELNITFSSYKSFGIDTVFQCCRQCAIYDNCILTELRNAQNVKNWTLYLTGGNSSKTITAVNDEEKSFCLKYFVPLEVVPQGNFCPDSFTKSDAGCLYVEPGFRVDWPTAKSNCQSFGDSVHLVQVDTQEVCTDKPDNPHNHHPIHYSKTDICGIRF